MTCQRITMPDGSTGIICSRGRRAKAPDQAKGNRTTLRRLAFGLVDLAAEKQPQLIRHNLTNGLRMVVQWKDGNWSLGLWRHESVPSAMEVEVCRDCFSVPEDAMQSIERKVRIGDPPAFWRGFVITWKGPKEFRPVVK